MMPESVNMLQSTAYLDVKIFVNLDSSAKYKDVLHEIGELPHASELSEHNLVVRCLCWLGRLHLQTPTLS